MQTVVIKPILFGNLLNKFLFLRKSSNKKINKKKIKNFAKTVAVIDYNPKIYKIILKKGLISTLKKYKGSFMVITNLQIFYIARVLYDQKFSLVSISINDKTNKTLDCQEPIYKAKFTNGKELISIYRTGVLKLKTQNIDNMNLYVKKIINAYYQSQGYISYA